MRNKYPRNLRVIRGGKRRETSPLQEILFPVDEGDRQATPEIQKPEIVQTPSLEVILINTLPGYAFAEETMRAFLSTEQTEPTRSTNIRRAYYFSRDSYFGLHNLFTRDGDFGMTHEMLGRQYPAEILAFARKVYGLKKMDNLPRELRNFDSLYGLTFDQVIAFVEEEIKSVLGERYGFTGFRVSYNKFRYLSQKPFRERMLTLPEDAKSKFLNAVRVPYRGETPDPYHKREVHDPDPDIIPNQEGVRIFAITHIPQFMNSIYKKNASAINPR